MKQERIFVAYKLLERLNRTKGLPFGMCVQLYKVKETLKPYYEAQQEKQMVLYEAAGIDENGQVMVTPELKKSLADIMKTEVDFILEPAKIYIKQEEANILGMTAEIIEQLNGFIEFVEVGA